MLITAGFYAWIVVFGWKALQSISKGPHYRKCALYAFIASIPIIWYCADYAAAMIKHRQLDAEVTDAQRLPKIINTPQTLTVHGGRARWQDALVEMGAFDEIYTEARGQKFRIANARSTHCDHQSRGNVSVQNIYRARMGFLVCAVETKVDTVPELGLHLHLTPRSRIDRDWSTYFDLWMIDGGGRRLVAFYGIPYLHYPAFPPWLNVLGFFGNDFIQKSPVPWYGEISFVFDRFNLDIDKLNPRAQPAPEEIRDQFLLMRDSQRPADQRVAGFIATATGASVLSADDVLPLMKSNAIDYDFAREIGSGQFCYHINRLCDFSEQLVAVCKQKRGTPEQLRRFPGAQRLCARLPDQCSFCRNAKLCQPSLTGSLAGCSEEEKAANEAVLKSFRSH